MRSLTYSWLVANKGINYIGIIFPYSLLSTSKILGTVTSAVTFTFHVVIISFRNVDKTRFEVD